MEWLLSKIGLGALSTIATSLQEAYAARLKAANDQDRIAADIVIRDLEARQAVVQAQLSHWWSALPMLTIMMAVALYVAKVIVWDTMLGLGETAPIRGAVGEWMNTIIISMFGYGGVGLIASRFTRRS